MDVKEVTTRIKIANTTPLLELFENDQTAPAGMWRTFLNGDAFAIQRATAVDWSTLDSWITFDGNSDVISFGKAVSFEDVNLVIENDTLLKFGATGSVLLNRSSTLAADTALASVLIGTPESQAIAADSLMISNVVASGDIALYVNKGGASQMVLWADGDTGDTAIMAASGQSVDIYIAGSKIIDISATGGIALATTLTPDANRTYIALSLGTRTTEKDITMAAADNQNLDPVQIKLNIIGAAPTNTSTVNGIYQLITHDTVDMANLRIKCADWNVSVGQDATDVYVYQGEIDIIATAAFSGEVICMSALVDLGAGSVATADRVCALQAMISGSGTAGTVTGDAIVAYFVNGGTVITTDDICRIYNQSAATVVNGLQIKNDGTMTNAIYISGTVAASIASPEAITLMPSGDTDDYFTFSTVADIPTITATGASYLAFGSDISIGANKLKTTNLLLKEKDATSLSIRTVADDAYLDLWGRSFKLTSDVTFTEATGYLQSSDTDGSVILLRAQDTGVGLVEIARLQGAADPFFQIGRDDTGVALNAVTDMLVLLGGAGTGNAAANFGYGISMLLSNAASENEERASIDFVLTDATNASEDVEINFKLQIAGAATAEVLSIVGTGIDLPTGKVMSVAGVQVVGARVVDERADDVVDATYGAEEAGVLDALRDAMIAHGLIAAA